MKQKQLLKPLFLLCALLVGGLNSLWAADETIIFSEQGYDNGVEITTVSGTNFTITFDKGTGSNAPKYYTTGTAIRAYGGNTFTVSSETKTIEKIEITFSSGEGSNAITADVGTYQNGTWTGSASSVTFTIGGTSGHRRLASIAVTYASATDTRTATTTTIDASGITNTDVYLNTEAGSLSATVKDEDGNTVTGATVTWSGSDDAVATIDANGAVTLVGAGTVTFTATYEGDGTNYKGSTATYEMTVTSSAPYVQPLTVEITPNYTFWGKSAQFSGDTYNALSGSKDNVELSWSRGSGSTYANTTAMRFYKDNTLTFTAPTGYVIKSIVIDGTLKNDETFSPGSFDSNSMTWTGNSATVTMSRPSNGSSYATINKYTITLEEASNLPTPTVTISGDLTLDLNGETNVSAGTLTAAVTYNEETVSGATVTWSSSDTEVATIDENGAVTLLKTGKVTFTATFAETTEYNEATGTKTITVTDSKGPGSSAENAYTVAQARAAIDADTGVDGVYVKGIVSKIVTAYSSQFGNISYNISADGSTTGAQLEAFRGKSFNGENFTSADDIQVGDEVVIYGNLTKYNSTYELAQDNQLVSLNRPVTISSAGYKAYNTTIDTDFSGTGVTAYVVTGHTAKSVTLEEVTAAPAGTPLVLKADGGDYTLKAAKETPAAPAKNLLQVSNGTVGDGATIYALANVDDSPGFYVVKEGLTIPTNYIVIPAGNAPALSFDFGEGTTGIRSIENGQLTIDNVYYDLSGRKLNAMPTQKGVYIVNGKKVVIK